MSDPSNKVTISGSMITEVEPTGELHITEGQTYSWPPAVTKNSGGDWEITLVAGRKKSSAVADGFNAATGGSIHEYAPSGGGGSPSELNFYFAVNLTVNIGGTHYKIPVYFAQGHYSLTNNWWIGGNGVVNDGKPLQLVVSDGTIEQILTMSGSHDSFAFSNA